MIAAFSYFPFEIPLLKALLYGTAFLVIALLLFNHRMHIYRHPIIQHPEE